MTTLFAPNHACTLPHIYYADVLNLCSPWWVRCLVGDSWTARILRIVPLHILR